jgi:early secretory antigenic target protein ESAT-6
MADYSIQVNFNALETAATQLRQKADTLQEQLRTLKSQLEPLAETWTGLTAQKYQEYWTQLSSGAQKLYDDINLLGTKAHAANELQQANERNMAAKFG